MELPYAAHTFDAAVMALVIFFVPDPAKGLAEMVRVVAPGGIVAAYAWDVMGGGFPLLPVQTEMRAMGFPAPLPPSSDVSRAEALHALWTNAALTTWRRGRSRCNGHSPISTTFGRRPCWPPVSARRSLQCHRMRQRC
jgi:SAM-dependent methyltransferase